MRLLDQDNYTGIYTFLGADYSKEITDDVDCVIYGMPYDAGTLSRSGARFGPGVLRKYGNCKPYHEELDINILENFKMIDYGDIDVLTGEVHEDMYNVISALLSIIENDVVTIGVGGDHTLAYPEMRALKEKYGKLALIHFDSHTDTWDAPNRDGTTKINQDTPFRLAVEQECLEKGSSIQVGMRGPIDSDDDYTYARENGITVVTAKEIHNTGIEACAKQIKETVGDSPVFVSLDIDFLDAAYVPGTGTPECGGFTTQETIELLQKSLKGVNIVGMDLVEVAPAYDSSEITMYASQAILREFAAILSYNKKLKG